MVVCDILYMNLKLQSTEPRIEWRKVQILGKGTSRKYRNVGGGVFGGGGVTTLINLSASGESKSTIAADKMAA